MSTSEPAGEARARWRVVATLHQGLARRRFAACVFALAMLLGLGSVAAERSLDDWILGLFVQGRGAQIGAPRRALDAFAFTTGAHSENQRLMDLGVMLPWWSDPGLKCAFPRPLAALTHWVDETCWPNSAALMHVHSLLWFALLLVSVCWLYRKVESSASVAGLSFALYALDDAHGATLGWIANRNALLAATFSCVALGAHDSFRRSQKLAPALLAITAFTCAWASSELACAGLGYLLAYALFLDPGPRSTRLWSVSPYLGVSLLWRSVGARLGYGVSGSGAYVDPITDGPRFLAQAPAKWLSLLQGQFGLIPADLAFLGPQPAQSLARVTGVITVVLVLCLLAPQVKSAHGRFWLFGMLFALLPMAATFPHDRLLLLVGLGAMPLLARALLSAYAGGARPKGAMERFRRSGALAFSVIHLLWAPLLLPLRSAQMNLLGRLERRAFRDSFADPALADTDYVVLSAPSLLLVNYALPRRQLLGLPSPRSLHVLSGADGALRVERSGPNALTLSPEQGFLATPLERHYRARAEELGVGYTARLRSFSAQVLSTTKDGRPSSVRFSFPQPIDRIVFLCWQGEAFERCAPPALGQARILPSVPLGPLLLRAAFAEDARG